MRRKPANGYKQVNTSLNTLSINAPIPERLDRNRGQKIDRVVKEDGLLPRGTRPLGELVERFKSTNIDINPSP
jgi:hypothetical protein